jgi:hypothetical protein
VPSKKQKKKKKKKKKKREDEEIDLRLYLKFCALEHIKNKIGNVRVT